MSKKVLIMSASTGGGHNRAARAIKDELEKKSINGEYIDCEIVDSLKMINNATDKIISGGYEKSAKYTPKAWGGMYKISDANIVSKNEFKGNLFNTLMCSKLKKLLRTSKPDLIIGTHPFPMISLSTLKKKYPSSDNYSNNNVFVPPLISVLTDYTAHSTYIQDELDYYVAGDEYVREVLISEGIEDKKIKVYGIPVEKSFLEHRQKEVVLEELGLSPDKFTVLVMGGSFGAGNIKDTLKELLDIDRDFQILVIAGRNESLKEKLEKSLSKYPVDKNISVIGFTKDMHDILSAVDVIVTKPGGLTTTECLIKELPMIVPYYIPGPEEENLDFLSNCGAALRTSKKFTLTVLLKVLIDNPSRIELLKNNIKSIKKQNAAEDIANLVVDILSD